MPRTKTTTEAGPPAAAPHGPGDRRLAWGLRLAVLAVPAGRLLGGPGTWGFDHLAYLPPAAFLPVALLAALLFLPDRLLASLVPSGLEGRLARLPGTRAGAVALTALALAAAWLLRTRSHFLGDGYLLLDLVAGGEASRPSGAFGFLLVRALASPGGASPASALAAYRAVSLLAAAVGCLLALRLLPTTGWAAPARLAFLGLQAASAAALLMCGYVENYALSLAFLSAFTLAGLGAAGGRLSLRWPAVLLALAAASHLVALLALPALLVLAASRDGTRAGARARAALAAALPTIVVVALLLVTLAAVDGGRGLAAARADANLASPLRALGGAHGLFSARTAIDVLNLLALLAPAPLLALLLGGRRPRAAGARSADPAARFLAAHGLVVLAAAVLLDPKLGAARDWDLLAPHSAVAVALALRAVPAAGPALGRLVLAAAVFAAPWLLLGTDAGGSARRLESVATSFAPYQRGYAYEGLALQRRQAGRLDEAVAMYAGATEAQPGNARFHALLGAALVARYNEVTGSGAPDEDLMRRAEASYGRAHDLNPAYPSVLENLARLRVRRGDHQGAEDLLEELARRQKLTGAQLQLLLVCRVGRGEHRAARVVYDRLLALDPGAQVPATWRAWLQGDGQGPPPALTPR